MKARHVIFASLAVFTGHLNAAPPPKFDLAAVEGSYELPAQRCVMLHDKRRDACLATVKDRLVIERIDHDNARLIVHSHQENLHECHVDGVAVTVDGRLRHCLAAEPGTCLMLSRDGEQLKFAVAVEGHAYVPFCGSRATLDGMVFPLSARLSRAHCPVAKRTARDTP